MRFNNLTKIIVLVLSLFFASVGMAQANSNFSTALSSSYTVRSDGAVVVSQTFSLTNKTPTLFVKQYALEFGSSRLEDVKVFDSKGKIEANVVATDNKTSIGISFADSIVGEGKQRSFTVQFVSRDIAIVSGTVLELYIPKLSNPNDYDDYQVIIKVPPKYGQPARVIPSATSMSVEQGLNVLTFAHSKGQGITALFGQRQIFEYTLGYFLNNPTSSTGIAQIALPPDTQRQKVEYSLLEPQPEDMQVDEDGNWIATYTLNPGQEQNVQLTGKVNLFLEDQLDLPRSLPVTAHTSAQKYWESDDANLKQIAKKLSSPREIYDYLVEKLKYSYTRANNSSSSLERLGAVATLKQPDQAVCQEFTDTFVALARANNIPARRAVGYAHTQNSRLRPLSVSQDILHTWPEYFDQSKQTWVPIDPTWGHTTGGVNYFDQFDFNHFTLAYNGVSSQTPYGAGSYKHPDAKGKDIQVQFGKPSEPPTLNLMTEIAPQVVWPIGIGNTFELTIQNQTGLAWYNLPITLTTAQETVTFKLHNESGREISQLDYLLPFQTRKLIITVQGISQFSSQVLPLTLTVQDISSSHELKTGINFSQIIRDKTVITVGLGGGVVFFAILGGSLLVSRRTRQRPLRR